MRRKHHACPCEIQNLTYHLSSGRTYKYFVPGHTGNILALLLLFLFNKLNTAYNLLLDAINYALKIWIQVQAKKYNIEGNGKYQFTYVI